MQVMVSSLSLRWLAQVADQDDDTQVPPLPPQPPPCHRALTMFSVHMHYRKCKHLTECHSQGYCCSSLLAVHLHAADQAQKHNPPQKKEKGKNHQMPFCRLSAPPGNNRGDIKGSLVQMSWNLLFSPNDFLSHPPYYEQI